MTSSWRFQRTGLPIIKMGLVCVIIGFIMLQLYNDKPSSVTAEHFFRNDNIGVAMSSVRQASSPGSRMSTLIPGNKFSSTPSPGSRMSRPSPGSRMSGNKISSTPSLKLPTAAELMGVRGLRSNVSLFSAIVGNYSNVRPWDTLILHGWEHHSIANLTFKCCFKFSRGDFVGASMLQKKAWSYNNVAMPVKQYICPVLQRNRSDVIQAVTISDAGSRCPRQLNWYIEPQYVYRHVGEIAVCAKFVYGSIAADDILTWFEMHRRLGVTKVMTYTYDLNPAAAKVLAYYRSIGLAEVVQFTLPTNATGRRNGAIGMKSHQAFNDEQLVVFDCQEKLRGYKYMVMLDMDEYLIPAPGYRDLKHLFDERFENAPNSAGFRFFVQIHVTSWGATSNSSVFKIGNYLNRTTAMNDRVKHVVKPGRIAIGGLSTHIFYPKYINNYKGYMMSVRYAVIHHFRSCRSHWVNRTTGEDKCYTFKRYTDPDVAFRMRLIEPDVIKLKQSILNN